jgi:H+/Na+-translocating ferredoxin:NAD+ oxidoreductase subunit D
MNSQTKFIVSHAPFWHNGSSVGHRNLNILGALLPAVLWGMFFYGMPAVGVISLSVATAILWEYGWNRAMKQSPTIVDGSAAVIGLLFGMLLPATAPWWLVLLGTFIAVVVGKLIFGGIGSNPFNPAATAIAILLVSYKDYFDFNGMLATYDFNHPMMYPLYALKNFGVSSVEAFTPGALILGQQSGAIGATFGLGLIIGGIYLILRGIIRWEIPVAFLAAMAVTAAVFNMADPSRFASPAFHLFTGYSLIGAFFLATDEASSPVNQIPMLIYGAIGGMMAILIRNIGVYVDGVVLAVLVMNMLTPLLDNIRPKPFGKVA